MKPRIVIGFCLFLFVSFSSVLAQKSPRTTHFSIFGFLSIPQGDFAGTMTNKAGYANMGVGASGELVKPLNESVNWTTSVLLSVNSFDGAALQSQLEGISVKPEDSYRSYWFMTGLTYHLTLSQRTTLYVLGQSGFMLSHFPDLTFYAGKASLQQTSTQGRAFAFGFGAGFIYEKILFGFRYYTAEPEYEHSAQFGSQTEVVRINLPITILMFNMGIYF